jgi:hypothetical protein
MGKKIKSHSTLKNPSSYHPKMQTELTLKILDQKVFREFSGGDFLKFLKIFSIK